MRIRRPKMPTVAVAALAGLLMTGCSNDQSSTEPVGKIEAVSPALARYDNERVQALWQDNSLSARDRGLVTVATLIATGRTGELGRYTERALDDGVSPAEISETVTHLGFYTGWPNAMDAVPVLADVFERRGVGTSDLPAASPELLPLDQQAEAQRARTVQDSVGPVSPGVVEGTSMLFHDLWLRPDLKPRDRSLITVVALIANGQAAQIPFHLNKAMDNGLGADEVDGLLTHVIYFTGWPRTMSAVPVVGEVLASRR